MYHVTIDRRADIIVVSAGGHPADINLYQAYKGIDNALDAVKRGGVMILVAECPRRTWKPSVLRLDDSTRRPQKRGAGS